jgi:hypothetical protein
MGQLHEKGASPTEQEDELAADPADDRVIGEQPSHGDKVTFAQHQEAGSTMAMGLLGVIFVPAALGLVTLLLFATAWLEDNVLSPRSLILHTVRTRSRRLRPEQVERLVAAQSERLLRNLER